MITFRQICLSPRSAGVLSLALLMGACGNLEWPPKSGGVGHASRPNPTVLSVPMNDKSLQAPDNVISVRQFDTVEVVAGRYGVSPRALIRANSLKAPYRLRPGMRLTLPEQRKHAVTRGDTISEIAHKYNVDAFELARLNRLSPPYTIYIGQDLSIPDTESKPVDLAAFKRPDAEERTVSRAPLPTIEATRDEPAPAPEQLRAEAAEPEPVIAEKIKSTPTPGVKPDRDTKVASLPQTRREPSRALPRARKGSAFGWPVDGRLVSSFGSKGSGLRNDGVNIAAKKGAPVRAARGGVVAYAGNELRGFGNLLLIKHPNGWVTAYAHNDTLLVDRGEKVSRGQVIARVGDTGNVTSPQIHFEIRKNNKAVDPVRQISGRANRRNARAKKSGYG